MPDKDSVTFPISAKSLSLRGAGWSHVHHASLCLLCPRPPCVLALCSRVYILFTVLKNLVKLVILFFCYKHGDQDSDIWLLTELKDSKSKWLPKVSVALASYQKVRLATMGRRWIVFVLIDLKKEESEISGKQHYNSQTTPFSKFTFILILHNTIFLFHLI